MTLTGHMDIVNSIAYIFTQLLGSLFSGACIHWLKPEIYAKNASKLGYPHLDKSTTPAQGFFMEMFGTFFLVLAIYSCFLNKSVTPAVRGAIIGVTLFFVIAAFGPITGGGFNPARTFGPSLITKEFTMKAWWIYYTGPLLGAVLGGLVYVFVFEGVDHDYNPASGDDTEGITGEMNKK
jgi:glycerol uptake facilitator-like aquaporin